MVGLIFFKMRKKLAQTRPSLTKTMLKIVENVDHQNVSIVHFLLPSQTLLLNVMLRQLDGS